MTAIEVRCDPAERGWICAVAVTDAGRERSSHRVRVSQSELARIAPDATDPTALVEASFAFLLEREPPESILRSFDLSDIGRYFPEYEREMSHRTRPG